MYNLCISDKIILSILFIAVGNKTTLDTGPRELGLDVRDELKKFHSTRYSANLMRLAVIGRGWLIPSVSRDSHMILFLIQRTWMS